MPEASHVIAPYGRGMRTTITISDDLAQSARDLGINMSAAARDGIAEAVRRAQALEDRAAYLRQPEGDDDAWDAAEAWT